MKTIHYPNKIRSHLVTIAPMTPFTPKSTLKLRSALHFNSGVPCSGKFSLVGTLAWHYGHISYRYRGGGRGCMNELSRVKIHENLNDIVQLGAF